MLTNDFDFKIPEYLIAQKPIKKRSDSRLLVYNKGSGNIIDSFIKDITDYLSPDHLLVFNNSKVIPARFIINKKDNNREGEILILKIVDTNKVEIITDKAKKYPLGTQIILPSSKSAVIKKEINEAGVKELVSEENIFTAEYIEKYGLVPLPPYIRKKPDKEDKKRYQTIYGKYYGSSAAPTAGLHFDNKIFEKLEEKNIDHAYVSLHVGLGTFQPIYSKNIEDHKIHKEEYFIERSNAKKINNAILNNKKIIPVGTTSLRTLETAYNGKKIKPGPGASELYIYPDYDFKITDGLITNFHTPRSSLAVLVSSLIGLEEFHRVYEYAVKNEYRFFSYGDAMLVL